MDQNISLLSTAEAISELAQALKTHKIIGFDTEFIRESTFYPIVEIIQVATDAESWLVDAQAFKKKAKPKEGVLYDPGLQPLLDIFTDSNILKIVHASQGDQECLYTSFGIVASPTLDTAVAASLCGYGDGLGLGKLLQLVLNVSVPKGHARTNWSARPLPEQLLAYAHEDVKYLVQLGQKLLEQLDTKSRKAWALELSAKSEEKSLYESDVEKMTLKLARGRRLEPKAFSALRALILWREERVKKLNLPRRWVADDNVLMDLAQVRPKDFAHLSTFRGLNKGELRASGEVILQTLAGAEVGVPVAVPAVSKPIIPTQEESQSLELLKCFINILADQHQIAAKHLTTSAQLLPLLRKKVEVIEDLIALGVLNEDAAVLIGKELIDFIHGRRALWINDSRVEIKALESQDG
jgi:ribonuclease D